ncbi:MAG: family transposase [Ferruginibacter sp.]|nr:family transposase [Ferruginibacter sp.]
MEFKNLKELMTYLKDEDVCREYYAQLRWGGNPTCPHCNAPRPYKLKGGKLYRCSDKTCKKNFTVTVKTIFEKSKIPLATWMGSMFLITAHKKGISSCQLARDMGITQKTAWFILHRIRYIMGDPAPEPLENTVEIDETYVGGKFKNMHLDRRKKYQELNMDNKVGIMGMLERDGKARLTVIGNSSWKDVIRENVNSSALLMTDTHLSYQGLIYEFAGHTTVNHSQGQYRDGMTYTNTVEGFFSSLKRSIYGIYHQISPKHLQQYCEETSYRYNTRKITDKERFVNSLSNADGYRLTYKKLTQKL